jgi:hypothetical protein
MAISKGAMRRVYFMLSMTFIVCGCFMAEKAYLQPKDCFSDEQVIALVEAVAQEDIESINRLAAAGADVNALGRSSKSRDRYEMTPLLWSLKAGKKKAFRRLLELGADPNAAIWGSGSVMYLAAASDDSEWLQMALAHKGNPDLASGAFGETPLFRAVQRESLKNLKLLIEAGADLNHKTTSGGPAINFAAAINRFDAVYCLLEAGADFRIKSGKQEYDLPYEVINTPIGRGGEQWRWREKVIDFLERHDVDFAPAARRVNDDAPDAAVRWTKYMGSRARDRVENQAQPE